MPDTVGTVRQLQDQIDAISAEHAAETRDDYRIPSDDPEYKRAKKRALNILSARDHSSAELRDKLLKKEHPEDVVETLIDKLTNANLLDDRAYAHGYVRAQRQSRSLSKKALRLQMRKKGLPDGAVAEALDDVQAEDEHELAFSVAMKKAHSTRGLPREVRERRILGMLARRGFPTGICLDVTRRALDEV
ncbi:regulatory protein RecX [Brevibacterium sp. HMSC063G07]|uniref:regulatory protein RecX n=1 Tax=Brevibacterium sp. HMSC063G07 TaxID=1739261 RepID=UPI0008A4D5B8|nr:regulatory protein RecX [Brevibacterium sp. HMSC063G07]OFL64861.1 recombination regulator RecX [Brevibacterium sp. HMSC063G07]